MKKPEVSVVVAGYNCDSYVDAAIQSILKQSKRHLEVIFVNDGSVDNTLNIVTQIASSDSRVEIVSTENQGLAAALNEGIARARAPWVARMDADDIAYPDRLERQLQWAERQRADVCGGWTISMGGASRRTRRYLEQDDAIKLMLCFRTAFSHPTVMLRTALARQFPYDTGLRRAQDYDLWTRLAASGARMTNLQARVLRYRVHPGQASANHASEQASSRDRSQSRYVEQMIDHPGAAALMNKFSSPSAQPSLEDAEALLPIIAEIPWASSRAKLAVYSLALRYVRPASMEGFHLARRLQKLLGERPNREMASLLVQSALNLSSSSLPYRLLKRLV